MVNAIGLALINLTLMDKIFSLHLDPFSFFVFLLRRNDIIHKEKGSFNKKYLKTSIS